MGGGGCGARAYLKTFDAVLILHLYRVPPALATTMLGHGISHEDHHIMSAYPNHPDRMRDHLLSRGVQLPPHVLETC